jgi:hypothetical protein
MKMKLISAVAVAALAMLSVPAFASTDLGVVGDGYSNGGSLGSVYAPSVITFTTTAAEFLTLAATVSNTTAELGSSSLVLTGPTNVSAAFAKGSSWNAAFSDFPGVEIAAGSYSFTISPAASSGARASGSYSIGITAVTPVPEISTWAMMLAGFGALGVAGYRRRALAV